MLVTEFIERVKPILVSTDMFEVLDMFLSNKDVSFFPVVNPAGEPIGLIREYELKDFTYARFGRDLIKRKRLTEFLTPCLAVDIDTKPDELLRLSSTNQSTEGLIIVDEKKYIGFLRAASLLKLYEQNRLDTEEQLAISERMASLGQLVAGLAHEINTPLGFAKSNLELVSENGKEIHATIEAAETLVTDLLANNFSEIKARILTVNERLGRLKKFDVVSENKELLGSSVVGLERIQDLVLNLKDFSRIDRADFQPANLNECLNSTLLMLSHVLKQYENVLVKTDFSTLPKIDCHAAELNQVFMNFTANAVQACKDKPSATVTIKTFAKEDMVAVEIRDTGQGIAAEHLAKLFTPFFTTKPVGEGTGLGLSISKKIITERHNGRIDVESTVGVGTAFTIWLPIHQNTSSPVLIGAELSD
jgi:two-component system, NtrC family, sensor kinase